MFFQTRNRIRANRQRIVLDLKPEGYQLKHFKEMLLRFFGEAIQEHICKAFWEYVLLLELCYKLLEKDRSVHVGNRRLYDAYQELSRVYNVDDYINEGDFSERMLKLVQQITDRFGDSTALKSSTLDGKELSRLLYTHDIRALRDQLMKYMKLKEEAWNMVAVSHFEGENSADYLIDLSLMRPRNLLNLVNYCKSNAVNMSRPKNYSRGHR
jgi:hypothetical protein